MNGYRDLSRHHFLRRLGSVETPGFVRGHRWRCRPEGARMGAMKTLRTETTDAGRSIGLCRAAETNTITPDLRDELAEALDEADEDRAVSVILVRADGPAFCAGYGLDGATAAQSEEHPLAHPDAGKRVWDSVADLRVMRRFVDTYMKL